MRSKIIFFYGLVAFTVSLIGCGGSVNTSNTTNANTNAAAPNPEGPLATTKKPEAETTNNAPTLSPVVAAYYDALKKKDDAQLRSVLSKEFQRSIEADMKADKKTGMAAYLAEFETIPATPVEVRNEKIEGNKASAEIRGGAYKTWTPFAFMNEGGKWKFTGGSSDLQTVQQSIGNSNK